MLPLLRMSVISRSSSSVMASPVGWPERSVTPIRMTPDRPAPGRSLANAQIASSMSLLAGLKLALRST